MDEEIFKELMEKFYADAAFYEDEESIEEDLEEYAHGEYWHVFTFYSFYANPKLHPGSNHGGATWKK